MLNLNFFVPFILKLTSGFDEDDVLDADDVHRKELNEVEIVETDIFSEIFDDDIVKHSENEIKAHVSSSTEDLIDLLEKEQMLIGKLT